jgi:5-hydroxyisourate hydrolase-like protein (transthyretin family)
METLYGQAEFKLYIICKILKSHGYPFNEIYVDYFDLQGNPFKTISKEVSGSDGEIRAILLGFDTEKYSSYKVWLKRPKEESDDSIKKTSKSKKKVRIQ